MDLSTAAEMLERWWPTSGSLSTLLGCGVNDSRLPYLLEGMRYKLEVCLELGLLDAAVIEAIVTQCPDVWPVQSRLAQAGLQEKGCSAGDRLALRGVLLSASCVHASLDEAIERFNQLHSDVNAALHNGQLSKAEEKRCWSLLRTAAGIMAATLKPQLFERGPLLVGDGREALYTDYLSTKEASSYDAALVGWCHVIYRMDRDG